MPVEHKCMEMESPHDTNRLKYITSDLIYMVLKGRFPSSATPRNLTVETFVRIVSLILMSNAFFWLEIIIYEVLLTFRESLQVPLEPVINSYQFHVHWGMNIVDVTVGCKNCCIGAKWIKRNWSEDLCMSLMYKRKSTGPNTDPCGTPYVMFDIEELEFLTETYCILFHK